MNQVIHTRGKKGFPSPFLVHIVCEQPPSYYQLNSKTKCEKKSAQKRITLIFPCWTWIRTHGLAKYNICRLKPQLTQPRSCIWILAIEMSVVQRNFSSQISNLSLKNSQTVMLNLLTCFCSSTYEL